MKKLILLGAVMLSVTGLIAADKIFEINEQHEILLPKSKMLGFSGIGFEKFAGYRFNSQDSGIVLECADSMPAALTVAFTAVLPELPQKDSVLFLRPGFHNTLFVTPQGKVGVSIWSKDKATGKYSNNIKILSKRAVRPGDGRFFRTALTIEPAEGGKSMVKLYLDGALEEEKTIDSELYGYSRVFHIGGAPQIKNITGFNGIIRSALVCSGALSPDEIASLR